MTVKELQSLYKLFITLIDLDETEKLRGILLSEIEDEEFKKDHTEKQPD